MISADRPWPGASTSTTSWSAARRVDLRAPAPAGLGEAVDQHERAARRPDARRAGTWRGSWQTGCGRMSATWRRDRKTSRRRSARPWSTSGPATASSTPSICPGSRSTPLALALAADDRITVHVHHDERSGGFLALGLAAASGEAVVVLTTSGTAAVELHPAVVEADLAGVPLLVCTANRPPELHDVGAPQAIDQTHLYGRSARWFHAPGVADEGAADRWRAPRRPRPRRGDRHPPRPGPPRPGVPRAPRRHAGTAPAALARPRARGCGGRRAARRTTPSSIWPATWPATAA